MNPRRRRLLIPGLLVALVIVVVVVSLSRQAKAEPPEAQTVSTLTDTRITESSGLVVSREHAGLAYTVNDSGHDPLVFAVDIASGRTVGTTLVEGVTWRDTEALSIDGDGTLWVADTGDNLRQRDDVALYAFAEPGPGDHRVSAERFGLHYPDGPRDVETLLVDPTSPAKWLVTKGLAGEVYRLPDRLDPSGNEVSDTGATVLGVATDGAITPDGALALVRSYTRLQVLDPARDFAVVAAIDLPRQDQGETLAAEAGGTFLIGSEGVGSTLLRLEVPEPVGPSPEPPPSPGAESEESDESGLASWAWVPVTGLLVAVALVVVVRLRRR